MVISMEIEGLVNAEIEREAFAAAQYDAAADWCNAQGLFGAEKYFRKSSGEETEHKRKFKAFLNDLGATSIEPAVANVTQSWPSLPVLINAAYDLEWTVTQAIQAIYWRAMQLGDSITFEFLDWFVAEQRSSLAELSDLQRMLRTFGADGAALLLFDEAMGERAG